MEYINIIPHPVVSAEDPVLADVKRLYFASFPEEERRPWMSLEKLVEGSGADFSMIAYFTASGVFAGFVTVWQLGAFRYIEHLATCAEMRGHGLGASVLRRLSSGSGYPLLLEVEPPEFGEMARRRIGFYERCGFTLHSAIDYVQPSYSPGLPALKLMLMSTGPIENPQAVIAELHSKVYGVASAQ